jgi:hypothetical protein
VFGDEEFAFRERADLVDNSVGSVADPFNALISSFVQLLHEIL